VKAAPLIAQAPKGVVIVPGQQVLRSAQFQQLKLVPFSVVPGHGRLDNKAALATAVDIAKEQLNRM
jgi:hypothetical protein